MKQKLNLPNRLTLLRFLLTFILLFLAVFPYGACNWDRMPLGNTGFDLIDLICCVLFVAASFTDMLDGKIARSRHLVTDLGKFMDPLADKALVNVSLIILAVYKPALMPAWMVCLFIVRDLAVDGLRFVAAGKGTVIAANIFGKAKTVAQMVALPFVFLNGFPFTYVSIQASRIFCIVLVAVALALSWISGGIYLYSGRNLIFSTEEH